MTAAASLTRLNPDGLIACPICDALHHDAAVPEGARAACRRCGAVLATPRSNAMTRIVMLAGTSAILLFAAVFFPFLDLSAAGRTQHSSLIDAVMVFSTGLTLPLAFAVAALIIVIPFARLAALVYVLGPMALGDKPARHALPAFAFAEAAKPWAMAEVFVVGVAVALVKIVGMATLTVGPAFWAFIALVLITVFQDNFMCRLTIWKTLEQRSRS
jgi:paraquat-inducible protein A